MKIFTAIFSRRNKHTNKTSILPIDLSQFKYSYILRNKNNNLDNKKVDVGLSTINQFKK